MQINLKNSNKQCWINPEDITAGIRETIPAHVAGHPLASGEATPEQIKYSVLIGGVWFTVADETQFETLISNIKDIE